MAIHVWIKTGGAGTASTGAYWDLGSAPGAGDIARFTAAGTADCTWDIAALNEIDTISNLYVGTISLSTNVALNGLKLNCVLTTTSASSRVLTFSGTPPYDSNKHYIENSSTASITDATKITYSITTTGQNVYFDRGYYPIISLTGSGNVKPESSTMSVADDSEITFQTLTIADSVTFKPTSATPTAADRLMKFTGRGSSSLVYTSSDTIFDMGYSTLTLIAPTGGYTLPASGNSGSGTGPYFTAKYHKLILSPASVGGWFKLKAGCTLDVNDLTVSTGASLKGEDTGSVILCVNKPTIEGTWGFVQLTQGVYIYPDVHALRWGVLSGGTGLNTLAAGSIVHGNKQGAMNTIAIGSAAQVLTVNSGATAPEWAAAGGGGGMTSFFLEDGDGTEVAISNAKEVKFVEGAGIDIDWTDTSDGTDADPYDLTFTVSDTTVAGDGGSTAITPGDTLTIAGGTNATSAMSGDTLTVNVDDAFVKNDADDTMAGTLTVDKNFTGTTTATTKGAFIDFDATGITASGQTATNIGLDLDLSSNVPTMVGNVNNTGIDIDLTASTSGVQKNVGLDVAVAGADTNYAAIFSGGYVGIGQSTPTHTLEVKDTAATTWFSRFQGREGNIRFNTYAHIHIQNDNTSPPTSDAIDDPMWSIGQRDSGVFDIAFGNISTQLVPSAKRILEMARVGAADGGAAMMGFYGTAAIVAPTLTVVGTPPAVAPTTAMPPAAPAAELTSTQTAINTLAAKIDTIVTALDNLGLSQ